MKKLNCDKCRADTKFMVIKWMSRARDLCKENKVIGWMFRVKTPGLGKSLVDMFVDSQVCPHNYWVE